MIHTYTVTHEPPTQGAPENLSTLVTPYAVGRSVIVTAADQVNPGQAIVEIREHQLTYPTFTRVEDVARRYTDCERCHLSNRRNRIAHIKGNPAATVVCIGEGPGHKEDTTGVTFCGPSGKLQEELFREVGIDPMRDVAWLNMVGCRPCNNRWADDRPPSLTEKLACSERTLGLLQVIRPRIVLCLGAQATDIFWAEPPPQNTWHTLRPRAHPDDKIIVGVARHPAYLLRAAVARYQEYFAAKLFLHRLKARMRGGLTRPAAWRFGLRYLRDVQPVVGC